MTPKKIITAAALAALALACGPAPAFAGSARGTSAFQFLQLGVGARPSAMGEVFTGMADDINTIYWNPAGLAGIKRGELSMTHALWFEDITYSNFVYGRPALGGTIGAGFNILNTGAIQKADYLGNRLTESYSAADMMGLVSYARPWGGFALGANLKYITSRIDSQSAHSLAGDLGALYSGFRPWGRKLGVGLAVQNVGTKAKYISEGNPLPLTFRAGGSLALFRYLLVASDLTYTEKDLNLHAGAEYTRAFGAFILAARAGYKGDTVKELGVLSALTAGLGVNWNDYQLDYAWNSFTDLGITHRISLGIKFAAPAAKAGPPAPAPVPVPAPIPVPAPAPVIAEAIIAPADTDNDGVTDPFDKCPGTSTGTAVDAAGCPLDSDADGVTDSMDKCPGTPAGIAVDAAGCQAGTKVEMQAIDRLALVAAPGSVTPGVVDAVLGAAGDPACHWDQAEKLCLKLLIEFDFDKAKLRGAYASRLKEIAAFMAANPGARIELQGHTDDRGSSEYNIRLSRDRANSVMKHFIEVNGLEAGRLSYKGIGKAQPAVSNLTDDGRQINRRVIAVLTMGNTKQQVKH